jgi:hypothetical protein
METSITVRVTSQGLLIPIGLVHEWLDQDIQVIKERQRIVIQRKSTPKAERERVLQVLEASGLLAKPQWEPTSPPVSSAELAELAEKFSVGQPLSEIVIEEREERW